MSLVRAERLEKSYRVGEVEVPAIRGVDFSIDAGAFVAFVGPSGSGKSTLLNLVGCLDHPSAGRLTVLDIDVASLSRTAAGSPTLARSLIDGGSRSTRAGSFETIG